MFVVGLMEGWLCTPMGSGLVTGTIVLVRCVHATKVQSMHLTSVEGWECDITLQRGRWGVRVVLMDRVETERQ